MAKGEMDGWCILRTAGPRTLPLTASLVAAGIDAWSPVETQARRRARSKVTVKREVAIAPTFVFARADRLPDLLRILRLPVSPHPSFSIFHPGGRVPLIADRDIAGLRAAEDRAKRRERKAERHVFATGARVRTDEGGFAGLSGIVEEADGKTALVAFGGTFRVRIASWLLRVDDLYAPQPA